MLIHMVVEAKKFDYSNQLFAHLLLLLSNEQKKGSDNMDGVAKSNWEKTFIAWIVALASQFNDVRACQSVRAYTELSVFFCFAHSCILLLQTTTRLWLLLTNSELSCRNVKRSWISSFQIAQKTASRS